uniref:DEFICIENS-like MADS-box transcription factor n=1 Tax=Phragmipedium longifolium TaxID=53134 RepID=C5I9S1_9ASPA|nr:DEFICIENS-like MADS-box transcription factor [Phragmipedium longifolium]
MGRGKIEIKRIENPTSRQVTYSKRRAGIMKKAAELSVLCDADLSLVMFSSTGRFSEYCSPSTDAKNMYDRYQQATGIDLWSSQYERMQNTLSHLKDVNHSLRREIRRRMGEDLDGMDIKELRGLEQNIDEALNLVRSRKYHVISTQTDTYKKKLKNSQETHKNLIRELEMEEHAVYYVDDDQCNNDGRLALVNEASYIYSLRTQPSHTNLLGLGYGSHDLRLA